MKKIQMILVILMLLLCAVSVQAAQTAGVCGGYERHRRAEQGRDEGHAADAAVVAPER